MGFDGANFQEPPDKAEYEAYEKEEKRKLSECCCPEGDFRFCHGENERLKLQYREAERLRIAEGERADSNYTRLKGVERLNESLQNALSKIADPMSDTHHVCSANWPKSKDYPCNCDTCTAKDALGEKRTQEKLETCHLCGAELSKLLKRHMMDGKEWPPKEQQTEKRKGECQCDLPHGAHANRCPALTDAVKRVVPVRNDKPGGDAARCGKCGKFYVDHADDDYHG